MRAKISKTAEPPSAAAASADACRRLREGATKARAARRRRKARSRPERRSRKRHSVGAKQRKEKIFSFFLGEGSWLLAPNSVGGACCGAVLGSS